MNNDKIFIDVKCDFEELWRYNIVAMVGAYVNDEQVDLAKHASEIAPIGAMLTAPPEGYNPNRSFTLECKAAEVLTLYIYVIPHTFPQCRDVAEVEPFELELVVRRGKKAVYKHRYDINQWSGENIEIRLDM